MATVTETIDQLKNNDAIKKLKHIFEGREREVVLFYNSNQDLKPPTDLMEESAKSFISEEHHDKMDILADVFDLRTAGDFQRTRPPELFNVGGGIDEAFVRSILYRGLEAKGIPFHHQLTRDHIKKNAQPKWQKFKKDRLASSNGSNGHPVNGSSANGVNGKKVVEETKPVANIAQQPEEKKETAPLLQDENQPENVHAETHLNGSSQVPSAEPANDTAEDQNDEKEIQPSAPSNTETEDDNNDQPQGDIMTNNQEAEAASAQTAQGTEFYKMELDYFSSLIVHSFFDKLKAHSINTFGDVAERTRQDLKSLGNIHKKTIPEFEEALKPFGLAFKDDPAFVHAEQQPKGNAYYPTYVANREEGKKYTRPRSKAAIIHNEMVDDPEVLQKVIDNLEIENPEDLFKFTIKDLVKENIIDVASPLNRIADNPEFNCHYAFEVALYSDETWKKRGYDPNELNENLKIVEPQGKLCVGLYQQGKKDILEAIKKREKEEQLKRQEEEALKAFQDQAQEKKSRFLSILKPKQP